MHSRLQKLHGRVMQTLEFQFSEKAEKYDGEFTLLHRLPKFIRLNNIFAPERWNPKNFPGLIELEKRYNARRYNATDRPRL